MRVVVFSLGLVIRMVVGEERIVVLVRRGVSRVSSLL
jgi:hypothetical protein